MSLTRPDELAADPLEAEHWSVWLAAILPAFCTHPFAAHHVEFWQWVWAMTPGVRPDPFVGIWPRGGAKSTSAEAACAALGARRKRRYALYICDTQDRADDHVANVGAMLEGERLELFYPEASDRAVGKFGNPKGWRRNRLRCANGFTVDAIGLDVAARGVKLEDQRPDLMIIDDIDGQHDSTRITKKKTGTLTGDLLPAGSEDRAVIAIQNLIIPDGVFAQLADGRADFLRTRYVSGPIPALRGFRVDEGGEVHGEASWVGQSLARCREQAADWGLRAFRREAQHEVADVEGALWRRDQIDAKRVSRDQLRTILNACVRIVTGVDPAASSGPDADDTGIITAGKSEAHWCPVCGSVGDGPHAFVLDDATCHLAPKGWAQRAVRSYDEHEGDSIVGENNNGGEMVESTMRVEDIGLPYRAVHASRGKRTRAEPIAALYGDPDDPDSWGRGRVHHVGSFDELEGQLSSWVPDSGQDSPDRMDALVWALTDLMLEPSSSKRRGAPVVRDAA